MLVSTGQQVGGMIERSILNQVVGAMQNNAIGAVQTEQIGSVKALSVGNVYTVKIGQQIKIDVGDEVGIGIGKNSQPKSLLIGRRRSLVRVFATSTRRGLCRCHPTSA